VTPARPIPTAPKVVALSGGVGGARFLDGLARVVPPASLTAIVNTGDDFVHLGLAVAPDLDTVMYTLAGLGDAARGWGLAGETWSAMDMVRRYGGPDWFSLGDRDLATHLVRSAALAEGETLTAVTSRLCRALGIACRVLPMCDAPRRTMIEAVEGGALPFQQWFVARRAEPAVRAVRFEGATAPSAAVVAAIDACDVVLVGPSNPYVSIDPIVTLDGVRAALARRPVIAVSPIVGGHAIKGPLATMIPELTGEPASAAAIARHYGDLLAGLVVERGDEAHPGLGALPVHATSTIMASPDDRTRLAREALAFVRAVAR